MIKLYQSDYFIQKYKELPQAMQEIVRKKLTLLSENPHHPSLRSGKLRGTDIFYSRINNDIRLTWWYYEEGILLRNSDMGTGVLSPKYT